MSKAATTDFGGDGAGGFAAMFAMLSNQVARSFYGSDGAKNQLGVGAGRDIPMLPGAIMGICLVTGLALAALLGRRRFLPKSVAKLPLRIAFFVAVFASMLAVVKLGEQAMKEKDAAQGPNFLPVTKLTTSGPYEYTRNPMYCFAIFFPVMMAVLTDDLQMGAIFLLLPWYLNYYVIPAEEALLLKLFGKEYAAYMEKVPRWLV
jgi:protein-S-isoprenylcysteine O-methyltransferase Ste14